MISQGYLLYLIIKPVEPKTETSIKPIDHYAYTTPAATLKKEANPHG
jgi:hypothetical protein